jgi:hypothetical protein
MNPPRGDLARGLLAGDLGEVRRAHRDTAEDVPEALGASEPVLLPGSLPVGPVTSGSGLGRKCTLVRRVGRLVLLRGMHVAPAVVGIGGLLIARLLGLRLSIRRLALLVRRK